MASLLALNDDCLNRIVSYLDDPGSFYNISLTCKRLFQVTKSSRNVIHSKILQSKAEYYIKSYLVDIGDTSEGSSKKRSEDYDKYCKLRDFLHGCTRLTAAKGILSYAKVIDVWQQNGPVVAKLFTWITNRESSKEEGEPRATCITQYRSVTLHLPSCDKKMVIDTKYFHDYIGNYDDELSIHVTCGDLDVTSEGFTRYCPEDFLYWEEEAIPTAARPMKQVIQLLQKELGDTAPPITDLFFVWLCFFFPDEGKLLEEHQISFKDAGRNAKPTPGSVQSAIERFHQNQAKTKFQDLVSGWKKDDEQESEYSKMIVETIHLLCQRSKTKLLQRLQEDAASFYEMAYDYELKKLPKQLLLDLILRTSLEASKYSPGSISDKFVESVVSFRCKGNKIINLWGGMNGDGASYPSWDRLELKFTLPDGKLLTLDTGYLDYRSKERPLPIEQLSPVTELLQEGINDRMQGGKIPKLNNLLTAVYFLRALNFSEAQETFLREYKQLIPSESDEESSSEESSSEDNEP